MSDFNQDVYDNHLLCDVVKVDGDEIRFENVDKYLKSLGMIPSRDEVEI